MAKLKKRPAPMPKAPINFTTNRRLRKSPSPRPSPQTVANDAGTTIQSFGLPPPSSLTPSSSTRRTRQSNANRNMTVDNMLLSSPLANRLENTQTAQSSPIRHIRPSQLPSPSPETHITHTTQHARSSPIKRKKVMFTENLINDSRIVPTPKKSILKFNPGPPQMDPLVPYSVTNSENHAGTLEFWTPGNIPRLSNPGSLNEELSFFKNIIQGGVSVLDLPDCAKKFEIYATINLLLKDLNDRKIMILLGYLPDLIRLIKLHMEEIENEIMDVETTNPFLVRTDIQITKVLTQLMANPKIINTFWKKSKQNFDFFKWCINHSSTIILKPTISKSLLTANLQLLKDHKLHSYLNLQAQEHILYSLLNMKYFSSSSLLVERLYTLKSLIMNHTIMMEKNAKSWLPFLLNCLCDFNSPIYQKQQTVAVQCLLESSKLFISSRNVNFEMKKLLSAPIHQTLQIAPETQLSLNSSPLDLMQSTFQYLTIRIDEQINDQCKLSMDLWLGITLLIYNDSAYLNDSPIQNTPWHDIVKKCLMSEDQDAKNHGIRAYKALIYVLAKNIRVVDSTKGETTPVAAVEKINERLELIFDVFNLVGEDYKYVDGLVNCGVQILYALLNNPLNTGIVELCWPFIDKFFKNLSKRSFYLEKICVRIFSHIVSAQQKNDAFYMVKCLGNDYFNLTEVQSLSPEVVLNIHASILSSFTQVVWYSKEELKTKVNCLSNLLSSFKNIAQNDNDVFTSMRLTQAINDYAIFFTIYLNSLEGLPMNEKLEYINKYIQMIKTNFGQKVFYKTVDKEVVFNNQNIFIKILDEISSRNDIKSSEVLKLILSHLKTAQYKFFETLVALNPSESIVQYIGNNLESKIFEKSLAVADIQSIGNVISSIPKSQQLLENYLLYTIKSNITNNIHFLKLAQWSAEDLFILTDMISENFEMLHTPLVHELTIALKTIETPNAIKLFKHWWNRNEAWLLLPFKEHIFFHILDPNKEYPEKVHFDALLFLHRYIKFLREKHFDHLDEFLTHGLNLCSAIHRDNKVNICAEKVRNAIKESLVHVDTAKLVKVTQILANEPAEETQIDAYKEVSSSDSSIEQTHLPKFPGLREVVVAVDSNSSEVEHDTVEIVNDNAGSQVDPIDEGSEESRDVVANTQESIDVPSQAAEQDDAIENSNSNEEVKTGSTQVIESVTEVQETSKTVEQTSVDGNDGNENAETQIITQVDLEIVDNKPTEGIEEEVEVQDKKSESNIGPSASIELTGDWNESNSSDHDREFYDARELTTVSSPLKGVNSAGDGHHLDLPTSDDTDKYYDSHEDRSPDVSKELIDPVNQVVETQEIPDSNEVPQAPTEAPDHEEEKENDIPSDTAMLYSSPLKIPKRKAEPLSDRVNESQAANIKLIPIRRDEASNYDSSEDDSDGLCEIDDAEFNRKIESSSSPKKRARSPVSVVSKKPRVEDNSSLDILTPPDDPPAIRPVDHITKMLGSLTDEEVAGLDDQEVYDIENRLLAFIMKMRARKQ